MITLTDTWSAEENRKSMKTAKNKRVQMRKIHVCCSKNASARYVNDMLRLQKSTHCQHFKYTFREIDSHEKKKRESATAGSAPDTDPNYCTYLIDLELTFVIVSK